MAKSGIFFSPSNYTEDFASLKLNKNAPSVLKSICSWSEKLKDKKLPSYRRAKLKSAIDHYAREFEKQLKAGKYTVRDVEGWCEDQESWDVISGGIVEMNDSLAADVAERDQQISELDDYWEDKDDIFVFEDKDDIKAASGAGDVAKAASGVDDDLLKDISVSSKGQISGWNDAIVKKAIERADGNWKDVSTAFGGKTGMQKISLNVKAFLVDYEKDPSAAAEKLLAGQNVQNQKILLAIAKQLKPDSQRFLEKAADFDIDYDLNDVGSLATGAKSAAKTAAAAAVDNDEVQDAASGVFGSALTPLGYARLAGKVASNALNGGKSVVDALGSWKIAKGEDKGVIAEMKFLIELPDGADYKRSDVRVAVRFDASDMKWHATCLDDRKLQLPEDVIVKKALATEEGKKFRKKALETWKQLLDPESSLGRLFAVALTDGESLGVKLPGDAKKMADVLKKMKDDMPKLENAFLKESRGVPSFISYLSEAKDGDGEDEQKDSGEDSSSEKKKTSVKQLAVDAIKRFGMNKGCDWLDELLGGQLKDALVKMYSDQKLGKMDDAELETELAELKKDKTFQKAVSSEKHQETKDSETGTSIDPKSEMFSAVWWSKDKSTSIASILNSIVTEVQKKAVEAEKQKNALPGKLKKLGVSLSQEDLDAYGPALEALVDKGADKKAVEDAVQKMKKEVKESLSRSWHCSASAIVESSRSRYSHHRNRLTAALLESETFLALVSPQRNILGEGFKSLVGKAFSKVSAMIPDKAKQKMKDFGSKALAVVSDKGVTGMLALAGIGVGIITGGWGAALALSAIYAVERHGKNLKATFDRQFAAFKSSHGVAARMDFSLAGSGDSKYSMRYYAAEQVWRVVNMRDQKKQVKLSRAKALLNGDEGKKFRDRLKQIWDPLFADSKGGEIDFEALLSNVKGIDIDKKALKLYSDFRSGYSDIVSSCCEKPKIDTRI